MEGGQFEGYSPIKLVANYLLQKMLSVLYGTRLSDLTYAYRIFRAGWCVPFGGRS